MINLINIEMQMFPPPLVRKIREAGLAPRVAVSRKRDVFLGSKDPCHDVATRSFGDWRIRILRHQPGQILVLNLCLECLVVAHVDGLHESGASRWDELNFDAERLDRADDQPHHMDSEGVEVE